MLCCVRSRCCLFQPAHKTADKRKDAQNYQLPPKIVRKFHHSPKPASCGFFVVQAPNTSAKEINMAVPAVARCLAQESIFPHVVNGVLC